MERLPGCGGDVLDNGNGRLSFKMWGMVKAGTGVALLNWNRNGFAKRIKEVDDVEDRSSQETFVGGVVETRGSCWSNERWGAGRRN